jgi:RNA polymerase sigma-70 factor (ECF subfamily)
MNDQERHNLFAELVTTHQSQLYGYIFALVRNWEDAADLFQSVCVVLWKKFDSYEPGVSQFFPWARQTAVFEVRNFLRRKKSRQHLAEEMLDALTETPFDREDDATAGYLEALGRCKQKLPTTDVELLDFHYSNDLSAQQIADRLGRSRQSVCNSLLRIRRWLMDCIRLGMVREEQAWEDRP